jgi:hypothetical protein
LLIFITHLSCSQNDKKNVIEQKQGIDTTNIIRGVDTSKFKLHKSGFYVSKDGDIYQRNGFTIPEVDSLESITLDWLDSTMFYENSETKKSLKSIIDLETFITDSTSRFEKDIRHVYYAWGTSDGVRRFIVENADPKTFKSIAESYGKDKSNVFYGIKIIKGADLKTFHVLKNKDSAQDKRHKYYLGYIED